LHTYSKHIPFYTKLSQLTLTKAQIVLLDQP